MTRQDQKALRFQNRIGPPQSGEELVPLLSRRLEVCELSGLRKFGSAEEKFGPLAREAQGARRCALQALPSCRVAA